MDAAARAAIKRSKGATESPAKPEEVLASMAACLIEDNTAIYHVDALPDPEPPTFAASKKVPKEIFYRKTQLFATEIPDDVGPKRCTCKYLCHGAPALIKCLSCVMYDPKNLGFFCQGCFDARHPWYRVPHIYNTIETDESVGHTLKVSHRRAEMVRFEEEGRDQYKQLMANKPKLQYLENDHDVVNGLKDAGFRAVALEQRMREFRKKIRADILSKPLDRDETTFGGKFQLDMIDDEAVAVIIRYYRGYKVRDVLSRFLANRLVRGIDQVTFREFFYDKVTKTSKWKKPLLLKESHIKMLPTKVIKMGSPTSSVKVPASASRK